MRYAIISDLHANLEATECVLERIQSLQIDRIFCLGDVVGYNSRPNECCNLLRQFEVPTVLGNHDAVACGLEEPWGFNPVALSAALWTREMLTEENRKWLLSLPDSRQVGEMLLVHGSPFDRDFYMFTWDDVLPYVSYLEESICDVCFFGHTHSPGIFAGDGAYTIDDQMQFPLGDGKAFFINPGSVGQPRDGDPRASFGVYDTETRIYEQVRVEYPVEETAEAVLSHGLPPFLAERLLHGR